MKNNRINGYLVVYLPDHNKRFIGPQMGWSHEPSIRDNKVYRGVDRYPWEDLDVAHRFGPKLSEGLEEIYKKVYGSIKWLAAGIRMTSSLEEAIKVLEFSNRNNLNSCEIIAIYSRKISENQGEFDSDVEINWIGCDIVRIGMGSMIKLGVFQADAFFERWGERLNKDGLIPDTKDSISFSQNLILDYKEFERNHNIEIMTDQEPFIDMIRIGVISPIDVISPL